MWLIFILVEKNCNKNMFVATKKTSRSRSQRANIQPTTHNPKTCENESDFVNIDKNFPGCLNKNFISTDSIQGTAKNKAKSKTLT